MTVPTCQLKRRISVGGAPSSLAVGELAIDAVNNALYAGCNSGVVQIGSMTNPMSALGDTLYGGASGAVTRLAGDTSNTRKFLREQSSGGVATAPVWDTLAAGDLPSAGFLPPGLICPYGGTVAPTGWVLCDGSSYSTSGSVGGISLAALATAIGYVYGGSAGTFYVPNLKGRVPIGAGTGSATGATAWQMDMTAHTQPVGIGVVGGEQTHTLSYQESGVPAHSHTVNPSGTTGVGGGGDGSLAGGNAGGGFNVTALSSNVAANASIPMSLVQPVCVVNYIIKL